ncbi:M1 family metallopeptidase [Massilia terrae]|uniref:M1 family metallopeptidase n=1 Tax=Massilia terrae TaxID=1811224 RepID=A0ABT2CYS1_9BURK|nr:M1 family metallopeptidase [Massilia terrae]MCS0659127.1 M1 family metallopeptidase [Massilia terrae]
MRRIVKTSLAAGCFAAGLAAAVVHQGAAPPAPVASPDAIALAPPGAAAVVAPSSADAWGGPRSGNEPTLSDRVVRYEIEATLDPKQHTVTGKEKLTWRNRSQQPVKSVYLHLYMNAFEGEQSTFFTEMRNEAAAFRSGVDIKDGEWGHIALSQVAQGGAKVPWTFVHPDNGPATDHTVVRFDLPQAVAPGASTTLDIDFLTQLPRVIARTGYFDSFHLVGQWFPKIGVLELPGERGATAPRWNAHEFHLYSEFYADFGSYDVKISAPKDYVVGAVGELQGAPVEKNGMLTHHYVQDDVHDFAWTADKNSGAPLEDTWTNPGSPQVKLRVLYPKEYVASAAPALKAAKDSLTYFSNTLGPYPYKTLTVVIPPHNATEAGGMEYPTFFTAEGYAKVEPGTLTADMLDFVTIHEFGHGYFYGILASNEFEEPMLDEGLNEYWDMRMMRDQNRPIHATTPLLKALGFAPKFKVFDYERGGSAREEPADPLGQHAWDRLQTIGPVYTRTATVMRDLEEKVGKPAMERAFKEYYRRWKFRHPSSADLRETLAEVTGQRDVVEQAFALHVYSANKVDDRLTSLTSVEQAPQPGTAEVGGKWVETTGKDADKKAEAAHEAWKKAHPKAKSGGPYPFLTTVTVRHYAAIVPQTLLVKFDDGSSETVQWTANERFHKFTWLKPAKAVSAELDPKGLYYIDASRLDNSRTLKADGSAAHRWGFDFAALAQLILSLIATV